MRGQAVQPAACGVPRALFAGLMVATALVGLTHSATAQTSALELVGTLDGPAELLVVLGDYAYVAAAAELRIIDLSTPEHPVERSVFTVPERIYGLHVSGMTAYLAGGLEGLHIVDVSDPDGPTLIATHSTPGQAMDVITIGTTALVGNLMTGLEVVDLSDPTTPRLVTTRETPGYPRAVTAWDALAYVVDQPSGIHVFDMRAPHDPSALASHPSEGGPARSVALADGRAYVVYQGSGLVEILDVTDAGTPHRVGSYDPPGRPELIAVQGTRIAVPNGRAGVEVVDVSDPGAPKVSGSYDTPGTARDAAFAGELLIVADGTGLVVLRVR
jgi:hypothetical protein